MTQRPLFTHALSAPFSLCSALPLCLSAWLIGCENPIDTSPNVLPKPAAGTESGVEAGATNAGQVQGGGSGDLSCESCPMVGDWYRFTIMQIASLDGDRTHGAIRTLNTLWANDINNDLLNVLFEVKEVSATQVKVRALNAARYNEPDTGYCLLPATAIEFVFERDGCDFINPEPSGINIYAGSVDIPKNCSPELPAPNTIPVRSVTLQGTFSDGCGQIIRGRVPSASIPQSGLSQTCTCILPTVESCEGLEPDFESEQCPGCNQRYTSLNQQLSLFGALTYSCEADGEASVCLEAEFEAERLNFTPSDCGP